MGLQKPDAAAHGDTSRPPLRDTVVKPPVAVMILAVLNLLVGGGGVLIAPIALTGVIAGTPDEQQAAPGMVRTSGMQGISFVWLIGSYYTSVLLIAAGIGLIRMRRWAWWMSVGCAVYRLLSFLLSRAVLLVMSIGAPAGRGEFFVLLVAGTAMLCLPQFLLPLLTLFILLPNYIRRTFASAMAARAAAFSTSSAEAAQRGKQDVWYYRAATRQVVGPLTKAKLDESVASGQIRGFCEVWQPGRPRVWAMDLYPYLRSTSPPAMRWLFFGPHLPPYRASDSKADGAGWKWAILIAPATFSAMLFVVVGLFVRFELASIPSVFMGSVALIVGPLALAAALFEWRWFFENRGARGVRSWAGDQGSRWLYMGVSGVILLFGYGLLGSSAMRAMAGKAPFFSATPDLVAEGGGAAVSPGKFTGERSMLCGGLGGAGFERFDPDHRPALGFRYQLGNWGGQEVIAKIEPLFDRSTSGEDVVMAKDGYQVGGLLADSGEFVNALRVIFVRAEAGQLDSADTYMSDWIGTSTNATAHQIGGDGRNVVGIFGREGIVTDALGLLFAPREE